MRGRSGYRWKRFVLVVIFTVLPALTGGCTQDISIQEDRAKTSVAVSQTAEGSEEDAVLRCYLGDIHKEVTPFTAWSDADARFLSLIYQQIREEQGYVIQTLRDTPQQGHTVYRISCEGEDCLDADTLIWNLYLRCQTGYTGIDEINRMALVGLDEYQYGASGKQLKNRKKMVRQKREKLWRKNRKTIEQKIIRPALEREYEWVESLYGDSSQKGLTGKFKNPSALFVWYFAPNTDYSVKKKSRDRVLRDVVRQYRGNVEKLSRVTGDNYEAVLRGIFIEKLWKEQAAGTGSIRGIRKLDSRTVEVETSLYQKKDKKRLEAIFLLSRSGQAGELSEKDLLSQGTGHYKIMDAGEDGWFLCARDRDKASIANVQVKTGKYKAVDCVEKIQAQELELAVIKDWLPQEKEETKRALERGDARWRVAARDYILFDSRKVNTTGLQEGAAMTDQVPELFDHIRLNESKKQ